MADGELADVRDHGEAVWPVHSVDSDDVAPADVGPTSVTSTYAVPPMKAMSIAPPTPMIDFGRPFA
jgi:hypothetical protein